MHLRKAQHPTQRLFLSVLLVISLLPQLLQALQIPQEERLSYYAQLYDKLEDGKEGQDLRHYLYQVLASFHVPQGQGPDKLVSSCEPYRKQGCYGHRYFSYLRARRFLFGYLHLDEVNGEYRVRCVYCNRDYGPQDFPKDRQPGPGQIPGHLTINTEHTWPQSRFSDRYAKSLQKSDLHAMYPTTPSANTQRSNFEFAEVHRITHDTCEPSRKGENKRGGSQTFYEPPDEHKGNVARALFYFAVRYKLPISDIEEYYLRRWHWEDPVDEFEIWRHERIYEKQGVRNPFIDHPELVDLVDRF